jgi:hypothetical protein
MNPRSKTALLDETSDMNEKLIMQMIAVNPLVKITGDNLDFYVRTGHTSSENQNKDLHMFTSNILFSRVATMDMNNSPIQYDVSKITPQQCLLNMEENKKLKRTYAVILGRLIAEQCQSMNWMKKYLPDHIAHRFSNEMSVKSTVHSLPLLNKNENNYEECIDILDSQSKLMEKYFTQAHGELIVCIKFCKKIRISSCIVCIKFCKKIRISSCTYATIAKEIAT